MYCVGDKIVHPMHGAGTIESIVSQTIDGKAREYYVLKLHTNNLTIMVPVDTSADIGIRDVISPNEADELLSCFSTIEIDDIPNWNKRCRDNAVKMKSGNLRDVACVIKSLWYRDLNFGLSTGERKMLHSALQILISELAIAKNSDKETTKKQLESLLSEVVTEKS